MLFQTNAFEEYDPKKAKKDDIEDGDESGFIIESGKPSPGQLTADKASCLMFSKYLMSSACCILSSFAVNSFY